MNKRKIILFLFSVLSVFVFAAGCSEPPKYTVTFDTVGGSDLEAVQLAEGESLGSLPTPVWSHYAFAGWYTEPDYSKALEISAMPAYDLHLYAKWRAKETFIITFNTNGGSKVNKVYVEEGGTAAKPAAPEKNGYAFGSWYIDEGLATPYNFDAAVNANLTLYAKWIDNSLTKLVNFYGNNVLIESFYADTGSTVKAPTFKSDIATSGWVDGEGNSFDFKSPVVTNLNLYTTYYTRTLVMSGNTVTGYTGTNLSAEIIIPPQITKIAANAFYEKTNIKTVKLFGNVTEIGNNAFYGCTALTSISDTQYVQTIGSYAFYNCRKLTSASIPAVTQISEGVFSGCSVLTSVEMNSVINSVGAYAFYNCKALANMNLTGRQLSSIGSYAFMNCTSLTSFTVPKETLTLGSGFLQGCTALTNLNVESGNTAFVKDSADGNIYNSAKSRLIYYNQSAQESSYFEVPDSVTDIDTAAFASNTNLTHIKIPASVERANGILNGCSKLDTLTIESFDKIKFLAYYYGAAINTDNGKNSAIVPSVLKTVILGSGVTEVPSYAFYGCKYLTAVNGLESVQKLNNYSLAYTTFIRNFTVGANLNSMGDGVFEGCSITGFTVNGNANFIAGANFLYNSSAKSLIKVLPSASAFDFSGLSGIEEIKGYAFEGCAMTSVTVPATVERIGYGAFANCRSLKNMSTPISGILSADVPFNSLFAGTAQVLDELTITGTADKIPAKAFEFSNIKKLTLPSTITEIESEAFADSTQLATIIGFDYIETIGEGAFFNCTSLVFGSFGSGLTYIGPSAFYGCTSLTGLVFPDTLVTISDWAFTSCTKLDSISFGVNSSLRDIGMFAFSSVILSGDLVLPVSLASIGSSAFGGTKIASLRFEGNLPAAELQIGVQAFMGNMLMSRIELPEHTVSIGSGSFGYCYVLENVYLPEGLRDIGGTAFVGCTVLKNITIPSTVISIGQDIFRYTQWYYDQPDGVLYNGHAVVGYKGPFQSKSVVFEQTVNETDITVICSKVFYSARGATLSGFYADLVETVTIPAGYVYISNSAFEATSTLKSVNIAGTVELIGSYAFYGCTKLTDITIGDASNGSNLTNIGYYAFAYTTALTSVTIYAAAAPTLYIDADATGDNIVFLGSPFEGCKNSIKIYVPADSTYTGDWADYIIEYIPSV